MDDSSQMISVFNKEKHGLDIYIQPYETEPTHPFLVLAYEPESNERVNYGLFDSNYGAKKVCDWLMGGFMFTGSLPTVEDFVRSRKKLGFL